MIDEKNTSLNKVKQSFKEILKFSKFFEFEGYKYCKFRILSYKKNNSWIIEYIRIDFTLKPIKQVRKHISKEENALYIQFSKQLMNILEIIDVDKDGVFLNINDYQIYFDNKFKSITYDKVISKLKNQYPYQFRESKTKLNFFYMHELYSGYNLQQYKYQRENFYDTKTEMIYTGADIFNDLMEMDYGLFSNCLILFVFPIYSFSFNHKIVKGNDEKIIIFEKKIPEGLKASIDIFYQLMDEKKQNLNENIIISKSFSGVIPISINWYGDESFLPKGTLIYKEEILVEKEQKEIKIKTQKNKKDFIEIDFLQYQLPDYEGIKKLIDLCSDHPEFYRILPNLIRNLYENLLRDIFSACLANKYTYLYYNTNRGRVRNFSRLIDLFKTLKHELESFYAMVIPDDIFKYLGKFRKDGNYSIHQIQSIIERDYAEKNREKFTITINILLQLYRKITTTGKKIKKIELNLLKKFKENHKSKEHQKNIKKNQIDEISQLISSIRFDIDNQVKTRLFEKRITTSGKNTIQKKIDELSSKVIQLKMKNLAYNRLVFSINRLDREFNTEFIHRGLLLRVLVDVSSYFKYAISDIYSKENNINSDSNLKIIIYFLSGFIIVLVTFLYLVALNII